MEADYDSYQERLDYLSIKRDRVEEEVDQLMDSLQDVLQQKKDELLGKLNELYSCERNKILTNIRTKQAAVLEMKSSLNKMKELIRSGSGDKIDEIAHMLEQKTINDDSSASPAYLVSLNVNVDCEELEDAIRQLQLGNVDAVYDDNGVTVIKPLFSSPSTSIASNSNTEEDFLRHSSVQGSVISTRVEGDMTGPKLSDIVVVDVNGIVTVVVTDRSNMRVKSFYKRGHLSFYSIKSTASPPRGIARVRAGRVGVTLPDSKTIMILEVTPVLKHDKTIKTSKRYRGIALLDSDRFVVSTYQSIPGMLDILDYQGNILHSILTDRNGRILFKSPYYLCTTAQHTIIVSDCERKTVTGISVTGNVIFQYKERREVTLEYPLGVAVDMSGDVLVVDCDNHKVVKILDEGKGVKEFLNKENGILGPYAVDVDAYGVIYVAEWEGNIKMFDTK